MDGGYIRTVACAPCVQGGPAKVEAGSKLGGKREKTDGGVEASRLHPTTGVIPVAVRSSRLVVEAER